MVLYPDSIPISVDSFCTRQLAHLVQAFNSTAKQSDLNLIYSVTNFRSLRIVDLLLLLTLTEIPTQVLEDEPHSGSITTLYTRIPVLIISTDNIGQSSDFDARQCGVPWQWCIPQLYAAFIACWCPIIRTWYSKLNAKTWTDVCRSILTK